MNTLENTGSEHARGLLYSHYNYQKEILFDTKKRFMGNGILSTIVGGGIIYAGAIGSAAVRERVEEYVPNVEYVETSDYDPTMEAVSIGTAVVGVALGGYLAVRGLIRVGKSLGLGKDHSTIKEADEKIN